MKLLLKFFVASTFLLLFALIGIVYCSLQSYPQIAQKHFINADAAKETQQLVQRVKGSFKTNNQPTTIIISKKELQSLSALSYRALPSVKSDFELSQTALNIELAIQLPLDISAKYLNISTLLFPSKTGLNIGEVSIGDITIEGRWILQALAWVLNNHVQEALGSNLLNMIRSVEIEKQTLVLNYQIPNELNTLDKEKQSGILTLAQQFSLFGDVDSIRAYYQLLVEFSQRNPKEKHVSKYLGYMFRVAKNRTFDEEGLAMIENKEALMALALYFGSNKFELLVGQMPELNVAQLRQRTIKRGSVNLNNRNDLQKHFIYSIALQLFSNSQASDAIGEMKEFLDANKGGSGFSFADLTADRAGTRIAMIATETELGAKRLQTLFAGKLSEEDIMPTIFDLPEGISQQTFEESYNDVNSLAYKNMLAKIDSRLAAIEAYRIR